MPVIIDKMASCEIFAELDKLNICYYKSCSLDFLYAPVNTHPDMQIHFTDNNTAIVAPSAYQYYKSTLPSYIQLIKGDNDPYCTYPGDCAYNVTKLGNKIIGNLRYTDNKIKEIYAEQGCEFINVKQGYSKCNLCIVNDFSVITEDEGLYKALCSKGIDVLKISAGSVKLPGFEHGFIGGASGFVSKNKLAFLGKPADSSVENSLNSFIKSKLVDIIYLSSTDLTDRGSILFF